MSRSNLALIMPVSKYEDCDFPVEIVPILDGASREVVTGYRGIRRTDTGRVLSIVSDKYKLIPHRETVRAAEAFVQRLGEPQRSYSLSRHGSILVATMNYAVHKSQIKVGEYASLRVFLMSSYTGAQMNRIRIGANILTCSNGMTIPGKSFTHHVRHTGAGKMSMPSCDEVLERFFIATEQWQRYAETEIGLFVPHFDKLAEDNVLPANGLTHVSDIFAKEPFGTVWDFVQACTNYVTHVNKSGPLGKITMLDKVAKWFAARFK